MELRILLVTHSESFRSRVVYTLRGTGCCEVEVVSDVGEAQAGFYKSRLAGDQHGGTFPSLIILDSSAGKRELLSFVRWLRDVQCWRGPLLCSIPEGLWSKSERENLTRLDCVCVTPMRWALPACRLLGLVEG